MKAARLWLSVLGLALFASVGCQPGADGQATQAGGGAQGHAHDHDHDHDHDPPESLMDGFQKLEDYYVSIKAAFEKGEPNAAHDELHHVADLLDEDDPHSLQAFLGNSDLSEDIQATLKEAMNSLFDAFAQLDDVLHGGPSVEFPEVDKKISEAMQKLRESMQ